MSPKFKQALFIVLMAAHLPNAHGDMTVQEFYKSNLKSEPCEVRVRREAATDLRAKFKNLVESVCKPRLERFTSFVNDLLNDTSVQAQRVRNLLGKCIQNNSPCDKETSESIARFAKGVGFSSSTVGSGDWVLAGNGIDYYDPSMSAVSGSALQAGVSTVRIKCVSSVNFMIGDFQSRAPFPLATFDGIGADAFLEKQMRAAIAKSCSASDRTKSDEHRTPGDKGPGRATGKVVD